MKEYKAIQTKTMTKTVAKVTKTKAQMKTTYLEFGKLNRLKADESQHCAISDNKLQWEDKLTVELRRA